MRIAVLGAGFAGLSVAWHALNQGMEVTLFDPHGLNGGASAAATGLLHPFVGKTASYSHHAEEAMGATGELLQIAEEALGREVALRTGIFRPAITAEQKRDFQKAVGSNAVWKKIGDLEGLWIAKGITVFPSLYRKGLLSACQKKGAMFVLKAPDMFALEKTFDQVILCVGAQILSYEFAKKWSLRTALGQSVLCQWERPLLYSLGSQGHIAPTEDAAICHVGATYEHTPVPSLQKLEEVLMKVSEIYPEAMHLKRLQSFSGVRVAPREGHEPIIIQVSDRTWVFTGLGSRGLLYHALYGRRVISCLMASLSC